MFLHCHFPGLGKSGFLSLRLCDKLRFLFIDSLLNIKGNALMRNVWDVLERASKQKGLE